MIDNQGHEPDFPDKAGQRRVIINVAGLCDAIELTARSHDYENRGGTTLL